MLYVGRGDGLSVVKGAMIEVMIMLCHAASNGRTAFIVHSVFFPSKTPY